MRAGLPASIWSRCLRQLGIADVVKQESRAARRAARKRRKLLRTARPKSASPSSARFSRSRDEAGRTAAGGYPGLHALYDRHPEGEHRPGRRARLRRPPHLARDGGALESRRLRAAEVSSTAVVPAKVTMTMLHRAVTAYETPPARGRRRWLTADIRYRAISSRRSAASRSRAWSAVIGSPNTKPCAYSQPS